MEVRALLPTTLWLSPYFFLLFHCLLFHFLLVIANIIMHPSQHSQIWPHGMACTKYLTIITSVVYNNYTARNELTGFCKMQVFPP